MDAPNQFNLPEAIETYLQGIDQDGLLSPDEKDELFDHLLTEVEYLEADGRTLEEAFALSISQFGSNELISQEYRQVKPYYTIRKAAIAVSLVTFSFLFIVSLVYVLPRVIAFLAYKFALEVSVAQYLDFTVKALLILGLIGYVWSRFRQRKFLKAWEMHLIPILGLSTIFLNFILNHFFFPRGFYSQEILIAAYWNNVIIITGLMIFALIFCYRLVLKWIKSKGQITTDAPGDTKAKIGMVIFVFITLAVFSFIHLITSFSLWLTGLGIMEETWIKLTDLVLKILFLGGLPAIIVSRIGKKQFFSKLELVLIPLIGFASPFLTELLFLTLFPPENFNKVLFGHLHFNSQIVLGFSIIMVTITTYILMFKERKQFKISG